VARTEEAAASWVLTTSQKKKNGKWNGVWVPRRVWFCAGKEGVGLVAGWWRPTSSGRKLINATNWQLPVGPFMVLKPCLVSFQFFLCCNVILTKDGVFFARYAMLI